MNEFWSIVLHITAFFSIVAIIIWIGFLIIGAVTTPNTEDQQELKKSKLKGLNFNSKDSIYDVIGGIGGFGWSG